MRQIRQTIARLSIVRAIIALLAIVSSAGLSAAGDGTPAAVRNCTWCHGTSAHGYGPAPEIAGQRHEYIANQLFDFHNHARDNPLSQQYMWGATASLDGQTARDLAMYFSMLPSKPANDGVRELAGIGRDIYFEGIPEMNIVPCAACHGPNAEGIRDIPRLGGLSFEYLRRRLAQWGEGYHAAAPPPMPQIASKLPPQQIDALASYLSFVR
jgi:cytochrome c553